MRTAPKVGGFAPMPIFLAILMLSGCGCRAPQEYVRIFALPFSEEEAEFKKLPPEKQVDMYIYAVCREPPRERFTDYLAGSGQEVIPALLQRLETERGDFAKADLINAFLVIHRKSYNLNGQTELLARLKRAAAKIRDSGEARQAFRSIKEIETEAGATPKVAGSP